MRNLKCNTLFGLGDNFFLFCAVSSQTMSFLLSFFLSLLLLGDLSGILVLFSKSGNFESRFLHIIARKKINRIKSVPSNSSIGFGHSSHESKSESVLPFPAGL